ncbi:MAG: hypothetical protein PHG82_05705 [Candidatus Gracilibacteria bacterium]|nr:hypothetical protein [Candidatus Gracilibacteria bacterium]
MKKSKNAFSIIEIIISTIILTIGVFGVYKLIGNNMNYIANNENLLQLNMMYNPLRECIKYIGYNSLSGSYNSGDNFSINFGQDNTECLTGSYNNTYDFTGVTLQNQEYYMYSKIIEKTATQIKLELNIYNTLNGYLFKTGSTNEDNKYLIIKNPN